MLLSWLRQCGSYENGTGVCQVHKTRDCLRLSVKNFLDIGVPSINENNGSSIEKCDRINKYVWHAFRGHSAGWAVFC